MTKERREEILKGAEAAFFEAMLDGWAGQLNRKSFMEKSNAGNTTTITYENEKFKVVDEYHTNDLSDFSSGTTTVFLKRLVTEEWRFGFDLVPVWWMSYGGRYKEESIYFLREALKENYKAGIFFGGRGPKEFPEGFFTDSRHGSLFYTNDVDRGYSEFEFFEGMEHVRKRDGKLVGFHKYFGMALI